MTSVLIQRGYLDADMHTGETSCEAESRDRVMLPEVKECQGLPEARGASGNRFFPHIPQKDSTLMIP